MNLFRGIGAVAGWLLALFGLLSAIVATLRFAWRTLRRWSRFLDDWFGTDEHPGMVKRVAELADELANVKRDLAETRAQLHPNGGSTVADAVRRIESKVGAVPPPPPDGQ